jgi:hypothetical protein
MYKVYVTVLFIVLSSVPAHAQGYVPPAFNPIGGATWGTHNLFVDMFNRSRANLGANYTNYINGLVPGSGAATGTNSSFYNAAALTGVSSVATQDLTVQCTPAATGYCGVGVRFTQAGGPPVHVIAQIGVTTTANDTINLRIVGQPLTCYWDRFTVPPGAALQANDGTYTSGSPGIIVDGSTATITSFTVNNPAAASGVTANVVIDGDSTAEGAAISSPWSDYLTFSRQKVNVTNVAVDGKGLGTARTIGPPGSGTIETMLSTGTSVVDTLCVSGIPNIVILLGGSNDISDGKSASTTYGYLTTYVTNRHAAACNWKVVVVPVLAARLRPLMRSSSSTTRW